MRWVAFLLVTVGCAPVEFDIIEVRSTGGEIIYTIFDSSVRIPMGSDALAVSRACYGLNASCSDRITTREDPACADPNLNLISSNGALELALDCYSPGGTCANTETGFQWSSGARNDNGLYFEPGAERPCLIFTNVIDGGDLISRYYSNFDP